MFRRDPLRLTLEQVGEALGRDTTSLLPLARQALAHGSGINGQLVRRIPQMAGPIRAALSLRLIGQQ